MNEAYRETQKKSEANAASSSGVACMPGYHCDKVKRQSRSILERGLGVRGGPARGPTHLLPFDKPVAHHLVDG